MNHSHSSTLKTEAAWFPACWYLPSKVQSTALEKIMILIQYYSLAKNLNYQNLNWLCTSVYLTLQLIKHYTSSATRKTCCLKQTYCRHLPTSQIPGIQISDSSYHCKYTHPKPMWVPGPAQDRHVPQADAQLARPLVQPWWVQQHQISCLGLKVLTRAITVLGLHEVSFRFP